MMPCCHRDCALTIQTRKATSTAVREHKSRKAPYPSNDSLLARPDQAILTGKTRSCGT